MAASVVGARGCPYARIGLALRIAPAMAIALVKRMRAGGPLSSGAKSAKLLT